MTTTAPETGRLLIDGTGMLCVTLLLHLRERIRDAAPDTIVHVIVTDPAAPLDLPAWCHLTGHSYLGLLPRHRTDQTVYALRIAADAAPTRSGAPWHRAPS